MDRPNSFHNLSSVLPAFSNKVREYSEVKTEAKRRRDGQARISKERGWSWRRVDHEGEQSRIIVIRGVQDFAIEADFCFA